MLGGARRLRPPSDSRAVMADPLYSRFNTRGKKQFKSTEWSTFVESYTDYAKLGLPAHKAALDGNIDCLKECFSSCSDQGVPSRDVNGATPLHLAVRKNQMETVKWLVRFTDMTAVDTAKHGETPAHVAAAQGHLESLKQILTVDMTSSIKSSLCTVVDNSGFSVLHLAIVKHRNECAKMLINELGSKAINALNDSGVTAAHISASAGNVEVLKYLSNKYKRLLTQEDKEGASPLYYAAQEGRLEALKFLYEKGRCSISSPCTDGLQPIHAASQCGHIHIIKYIVSCCGNQAIFDVTPDGATPLHFATSSGRVNVAEWLINSDTGGTLVNKKDGNGDTPAHDAAESGDIAMLKLLLESGADLYATNNDGRTPYSIALSGGNMDTANYVMTYATKAPQRDSVGPVKIFNLQGEMDTVDTNVTPEDTQDAHPDQIKSQDLLPSFDTKNYPRTNINVFLEKKDAKKDKKKDKKEAKKDKKDNKKSKKEQNQSKGQLSNSNSFMDSTAQTLQSLNTSLPSQSGNIVDEQDADLSMTEEELALFSGDKPSNTTPDESIVVRYSGPEAINPLVVQDKPDEPGYSTVQEVAMMEERKEQKLGRKISKSLTKAIKSGSGVQGKSSKKGFDDNAMGFKPQFRSNPLQRLGGSIPPTPPPTPATGASIAPSDETPPHNLADVDEVDDASGFAPYAVPDPEIAKTKAEKRQRETSENQKLLKDALQDLSSGESPPEIPKRAYEEESSNSPESKTHFNPESSEIQKGLRIKLQSPKVSRSQPTASDVDASNAVSELSRIKLKKTTDWKRAKYSRPETETTSGASDELRNLFKRKALD